MIPLENKANAECQDYRTISLISHALKIVLIDRTKRIEAKATAVNWITNEQLGFRKGVGSSDAIGVSITLRERSLGKYRRWSESQWIIGESCAIC